jgi:16S rRNA (cytidine1402-2'-O)-methyltransferase
MVFYEAPHRLKKTLNYLKNEFGGDREIAAVREITKIYEQVQKGSIDDILNAYEDKTPKGEFVIVVKGGISKIKEQVNNITIEERFNQLLLENYDKKEAMRVIAKERNISRRDVYSKLNT